MKQRVWFCLALFWLVATARADAVIRTVNLETSPGRADVYESGSKLVGQTSSGIYGTLELRLDDSVPHSFKLTCKPYNDMRVTIIWTADHWMVRDSDVLAPNGALTRLNFSRDVSFDIVPAPVATWQVVPSAVQGGGQKVIENYSVARMEQTPGGASIVRVAYQANRLFLESPRGEMLPVVFKEGELSGQPLGDFIVSGLAWKQSGPSVAIIAAIVGLLVVAGLAVFLWRRSRGAAVPPMPPQHAQGTAIAHVDDRLRDSDELPNLVGAVLTTDMGHSFRVLRRIGKGGMGAVFEAESVGSADRDMPWAIKVLYSGSWDEPEFRERFQREVKFCVSLHHPNIVKILDWGLYVRPDGGRREWPFMVMERINGVELSRYIANGGDGASPRQAVGWIIEALQALAVTHGAGIIHRDLKPANIMITARGHVKIMDFGVARQDEMDGLTRTDTAIGTPYYMSPEHLDAKHVTPASDVYSMGIILFEILSGQTPFEGRDVSQVLASKLQGRSLQLATLRPDLPPRLCQITHRMFARVPEMRYMSVDAVIDELEPLLETLSNETPGGTDRV